MKNKLIKKGGALFLALFLVFTTLSPVNAYAKSGIIEYNLLRVLAMNRDGTILLDKQGSLSDVRSIIGDFNQTEVQTIQIDYGIDGTLAAGDTLTANIAFIVSRYKSFGGFMVRLLMQGGRSYILSDAIVDYDYSSSTLTVSNMVMPVDVPENSFISIGMGNPTYNADYSSVVFGFGIKSYDMNSQSEQTGFFNNIIQWLKDIVDKIKGLPDAIGNFINSLGDKISGFFTNLTNNLKTWFDNIGKWFTDLGNNIKQWFTNLTNNLKTWFDNVGKWFDDLGNNIKSWFNALFNKLWWGNENGESEYTPPVFSSGLMDVLDTIAEYCDSLDNTLAQIENASSSASEYINQGTSVINSVLGVLPSAVIVLITFGIVFIFSRKVVGR